jgi:hypothetical protein
MMKQHPIFSVFVFLSLSCAVAAGGMSDNPMALESMLGKYDGVIQVVRIDAVQHPYQTEIVSVDKRDNTVSLTAYCPDCEVKELKRLKCKITETNERIKFVCKGPTSDEEYLFNGTRLKASGFGHQFPYIINVTRTDK